MPKCVKCNDYFHPDYCIETNIRGDDVIICLFCRLDKKELTIVDEDDKTITGKVLKKEATVNYKRYLDDLIRQPNIAKTISKE